MATLQVINKPGDYGNIEIMGTDRNNDIGLTVECWGNDEININSIIIGNTFLPLLIKGDGTVNVNYSLLYLFGGDAVNIRGSNSHFDYLNIEGNTPTRPYKLIEVLPGDSIEATLYKNEVTVYDPTMVRTFERNGKVYLEYYHQDAIQGYATAKGKYHSTPDDILDNVTVKNLSINMTGKNSQSISFTEKCGYNNIHIGTEKMNINTDYYYSLIAVNFNNFQIGNPNVCNVNKPVRLQQPKGKENPYWFYDGKIYIPGEHQIEDTAENIEIIVPDKYK